MFREPPIDPPTHYWSDYLKPELIEKQLNEICKDIITKGENTRYESIFAMLYEHVENNLEQFIPGEDYD